MKMTHTAHSISNSNHTRCAASDVMHGSSPCTHPRALIACIYAVFSFGLNQQDCLVLESAERFLHGHQDGMLSALFFADWAAMCQDGMLFALLFADWAAMCHDSSQGAERSKCYNCVLPNNTLSPKPCICCRW